jgi:hypothetical protein
MNRWVWSIYFIGRARGHVTSEDAAWFENANR